jgi:hypothetical protein
MTFARLTTVLACATAALLFAAGGLRADNKADKEAQAKAEKVVKDFLDDKKVTIPAKPIEDEALAKAFPGSHFFSLGFPQFPVARRAPEPFKSQNLFIVPKDGKMVHLTDTKELEKFFKDNLKAVKDDDAAKQAAQAWLLLSVTFKQDGFFKFAVPKDALKVAEEKGEKKASGKADVTQGGKGDLVATLTFDDKGKLAKVAEENAIKPGVRPICQATKLLDADPLVRRIAEQDILVMGRACKDYLDEQRAKAAPELKQAIDRIWKRIVDEGW